MSWLRFGPLWSLRAILVNWLCVSALCGFAQVASTLGVRAKTSAGATVYAVIVFVTSVRVVGVRAERAPSVRALIVRVV